MYLDEYIDQLKKQFPPQDFKVPFTEGSNILQSIEREFIITKDIKKNLNNLRHRYSNWADNIKQKTAIKSVDLRDNSKWLQRLDANTNYWMVIASSVSPSYKHFVYDCKPKALLALFSVTQDDFFIVDKKYRWFAYFQVNNNPKEAMIFRSGDKFTPFESR